jgi:hypothetical protein
VIACLLLCVIFNTVAIFEGEAKKMMIPERQMRLPSASSPNVSSTVAIIWLKSEDALMSWIHSSFPRDRLESVSKYFFKASPFRNPPQKNDRTTPKNVSAGSNDIEKAQEGKMLINSGRFQSGISRPKQTSKITKTDQVIGLDDWPE